MAEPDDMDFGDLDEEDDEIVEAEIIERVNPKLVEERSSVSMSLPTRRMVGFMDVYNSEEELKFLIENVLPESGIVFFGGLSGTGKTILAIQCTVNLIMNRPTMTWKPVDELEQMTALMLSLEMNELEFKRRIKDMYPKLSEEEQKTLQENFILYSDPEPFELWNNDHVVDLILMIKKSRAKIILIDSASVSFGDSLKDDTQVNKSLRNLHTIRTRLNVCILIVAHTRKPPSGISTSPEDLTINDLFGHSGIAQWGSSIFLLVEDEATRRKTIQDKNGDEVDKVVHVINVKTRFGASNGAFKAKLTSLKDTKAGSPLQFRRDAIELPAAPKSKVKVNPLKATMADIVKGMNLSSILEDDDI